MSSDHPIHDEVLAALVEGRRVGTRPDPHITEHLATCPDCQAQWEDITSTIVRLNAARGMLPLGAEPPPGLRERTRRAIATADGKETTPQTGRGSRWRFGWAGIGAAAGAAVMAAILAIVPIRSAAVETFELVGGEGAAELSAIVEIRQADAGSVSMRLVADNLPANRPGEFYELWWVGPDKRHLACGTFRSDGTALDLTFTSAADLDATLLLEITVERDDGDTAPGPHIAQSRPADAGPTWSPAH